MNNLTPEHIAQLVLYRHYTDKYSYASISNISEALDELIHEGLITVLDERGTDRVDIVLSERGRHSLLEIGRPVIMRTLFESGRRDLLHICYRELTLADLPILLTSSNEQIRTLARKIYSKWDELAKNSIG